MIFNFFVVFFYHAGQWLDKKARVTFKIYKITDKITNNYNKLIAQYLQM